MRRLTHAQKIIYATRAGQTGRAILMQQPSPLLLLYLCKNPLITLPEIIRRLFRLRACPASMPW